MPSICLYCLECADMKSTNHQLIWTIPMYENPLARSSPLFKNVANIRINSGIVSIYFV